MIPNSDDHTHTNIHHHEENNMLKRGATVLSIWSGINFLLASLILTSVVIFKANSPLLVMVFEKSEIARLDTRVIESFNALTILYNSCSMVLSVLVWLLIRKKFDRWPKMGFLGIAVRDWLCGSDGFYRFWKSRKCEMAGKCHSECFICCRHWVVWPRYVQVVEPGYRTTSNTQIKAMNCPRGINRIYGYKFRPAVAN